MYQRGGVSSVHLATGISRPTIYAGLCELEEVDRLETSRIRKPGGGRKQIEGHYPDILEKLESLVEPDSRGDPESPLRWTTKSTRHLSDQLKQEGYQLGANKVLRLLLQLHYRLQSNKKTKEGGDHPDRDQQFHYINEQAKKFHAQRQPVISVDTKKKENIGEFKNPGQQWRPKGSPTEVKVYDFIDQELGKVAPYGIYDIFSNEGWVSVGISGDTAQFAVNSIRDWYQQIALKKYNSIKKMMITADCGGSNGNRVRLWKRELQKFADEKKVRVTVCHYPPGTSKWNKIEHRMFSFISQNWKGQPLLTQQTVIDLISHTKTKTGLKITAVLDQNRYEKGIKVSDQEMQQIKLRKHTWHGEWNYTISPKDRVV